mmetsp:Transcript_30018/g.87426  ORF Transcript_30018/g.87426 Transcript_30018/m.87426 type:complete len:323 (-) Transcript_30018:377-1345(-)
MCGRSGLVCAQRQCRKGKRATRTRRASAPELPVQTPDPRPPQVPLPSVSLHLEPRRWVESARRAAAEEKASPITVHFALPQTRQPPGLPQRPEGTRRSRHRRPSWQPKSLVVPSADRCGGALLLVVVAFRRFATFAVAEVHVGGFDIRDAYHGWAQAGGHTREDLGVVEVSYCLNDGLGASSRISTLKDSGTDEDAIHAKLHHQSGVSRGGHTTGSKVHDRKTPILGDRFDEVQGGLDALRKHEHLVLVHGLEAANLAVDGARVTYSFHHVASASLALRPEHGAALGHTTKRLAEVTAAADEGHLELGLVNVVLFVRHGQDL